MIGFQHSICSTDPLLGIAEIVLQRIASHTGFHFPFFTLHLSSLHICWSISHEVCGFLWHISNNIYTGCYLMNRINIYHKSSLLIMDRGQKSDQSMLGTWPEGCCCPMKHLVDWEVRCVSELVCSPTWVSFYDFLSLASTVHVHFPLCLITHTPHIPNSCFSC